MVIDYKYRVLTQKTTIKISAETTDTIISYNQDNNPPELLINTASYFGMEFIRLLLFESLFAFRTFKLPISMRHLMLLH